ncbi:hypothetical protein ACERNI_16720 [Camelimonas sp. ID_303_24]
MLLDMYLSRRNCVLRDQNWSHYRKPVPASFVALAQVLTCCTCARSCFPAGRSGPDAARPKVAKPGLAIAACGGWRPKDKPGSRDVSGAEPSQQRDESSLRKILRKIFARQHARRRSGLAASCCIEQARRDRAALLVSISMFFRKSSSRFFAKMLLTAQNGDTQP